jgi:hypothetical protein
MISSHQPGVGSRCSTQHVPKATAGEDQDCVVAVVIERAPGSYAIVGLTSVPPRCIGKLAR